MLNGCPSHRGRNFLAYRNSRRKESSNRKIALWSMTQNLTKSSKIVRLTKHPNASYPISSKATLTPKAICQPISTKYHLADKCPRQQARCRHPSMPTLETSKNRNQSETRMILILWEESRVQSRSRTWWLESMTWSWRIVMDPIRRYWSQSQTL